MFELGEHSQLLVLPRLKQVNGKPKKRPYS